MKKALFLDRDGIINVDSGYVHTIDSFVFVDGIFDLCHRAEQSGYLIIVVTNQAGIGRGYYSEGDFLNLTEWMSGQFEKNGVKITKVYFCPYHIDGIGIYKQASFRRKPNPGMILEACVEHGIDPKQSIIIGDKETDIESGLNALVGTTIIIDKSNAHTKAQYKFDSLIQLMLSKSFSNIFN